MRSKLEKWDGKDTNYLAEIYATENADEFLENTLSLVFDSKLIQVAATWLLKRYLEDGHKLNKIQIEKIYLNLDQLDSWESKLHVLQIIPYIKISKKIKNKLERFLRVHLTDSNKFIRAWTYNGYYELCVAFPEYKEEVKQFFEMAMRDEAPSVKSRIRNILKQGF